MNGRRRVLRLCWLALTAALGAAVGCEAPGKPPPPSVFGNRDATEREQEMRAQEARRVDPEIAPTYDDIIEIAQFWPTVPWRTDLGRTVGFRVPTYFVSAETRKGAFVAGNITATIYVLEPRRGGGFVRTVAHRWVLDEALSAPFRVTKEVLGGFYYGFVLNWPEDVRLDGEQIEIQFAYERADGRVVTSSARQFRVPAAVDPDAADSPESAQPNPAPRSRTRTITPGGRVVPPGAAARESAASAPDAEVESAPEPPRITRFRPRAARPRPASNPAAEGAEAPASRESGAGAEDFGPPPPKRRPPADEEP